MSYHRVSQIFQALILFAVSIVAVVFSMYAVSVISNLYLYSANITTSKIYKEPQTPNDVPAAQETATKAPETTILDMQVQSSSDAVPVQITKQENTEANSRPLLTKQATNEEDEDSETPDHPSTLTREERMEWFRQKGPELEILKSNDMGQKFHDRVLEFFNKECTNKFFMTWFSPARTFGKREFLTADTLLKADPQACLMILSRSLDTDRGYKILKPLIDRGFKIVAVAPDVPFLVKSTPAEAWLDDIKSGKKDPGSISLSIHLSDLIRLAILYRYGGVYLDTDFIILKKFEGLRNAVGVQRMDEATQNWKDVNGAAMIFDIGHPILVEFLKEYATTFNGSFWGHNGPYLLTRVIKRLDREGASRYNITILPPEAVYPVDWNHIGMLYKKPKTAEESKLVEDTVVELSRESYGLHLWNKVSRQFVIEEGSVIERLIASHCNICLYTYNS